jgi:hypothetical protein
MPRVRIGVLIGVAVFAAAAEPLLLRAQAPAAGGQAVRFHHVHYRVADPSASMTGVLAKVQGIRVVVPGLGVGVRTGSDYLLFDRSDQSDHTELQQPSIADAYAAAAAWLRARGITAPATPNLLRAGRELLPPRYHHIGFVADDLPATTRTLEAAGASALLRNEDAVLFDAGGGVLVEIVRDPERAETFWCPMHPDVRSAEAGKCPLCSMDLVPIPPPKIGEYDLDVTQVRSGNRRVTTGLKLAIREPGTNRLVPGLSLVHEKRLHLFIVSSDLEYFAHVHPEPQQDGGFELKHPLRAGEYMLFADFLPEGGTFQMVQKAIIVSAPSSSRPKPSTAEGLLVSLKTEDLAAGRHACLTFTVKDAGTGEPVTDLQPYLGAPAHLFVIRSDLRDAVHAHPEEIVATGPSVSFHPLIPATGRYKLWVQFQRAGRVSTTSFEFTVR